jgi:predicted MPP superfamily phosphohydrolase
VRLAWLTDIHLDHAPESRLDDLCRAIRTAGVGGILLGGDFGEALDVAEYLQALEAELGLPIHFVLGNHDFYGGAIASVRAEVAALCARSPRLDYLSRAGIVALTEQTGLVGHDGWADGRLGDYARSKVELNDYRRIEELSGLDESDRLERLHALGDEAAAHFRAVLPEASERFRRLIVLTHVPPFREACWYRGRISYDDWLPHFSCKAVGEVLAEVMAVHPECEMTVLCGHTHSPGEVQILPNLRVFTGGAEYGRPAVQRILVAE